ncbi:hypothetical protein M422DRAFT_27373 [Sphaerobolus stellatus SS14]|nr:hypothetical protein M422DRAFT_27373 [Sphaerobolus stellatus SS14]
MGTIGNQTLITHLNPKGLNECVLHVENLESRCKLSRSKLHWLMVMRAIEPLTNWNM